MGGWDAWNVTEDADLGFRLAATGYEMGVLATPTYEAAPDRLSIWLPQRSRWVKGYMQTFGVQSRQTSYWVARSLMSFAVTIGAAILAATRRVLRLAGFSESGLVIMGKIRQRSF